MAIETNCPGCNKLLRVADDYAGKQARCPVCNTIYTIPSPGASQAVEAEVATESTGASATDESWFMKTPEGRVYGPVAKLELDRWLTEGRITAECELRCGEGGTWQSADQTYGALRPIRLQPTTASPFQPVAAGPSPASGFAPSSHHGRQFLASHRGVLILVLGILAWFFTCPVLGIAAWVMGSSDLREMRSGRMDPSGMGLTQAGHILGLINALLWILFATIAMFIFLFAAAAGGF